jgi:acetyl-CoA carboxylase carboxyltransferase component
MNASLSMGRAYYAWAGGNRPTGATNFVPVAERTMAEKLEDLERRRGSALQAGPADAIERQHGRGKMTARERIDYLIDPGTFQELDLLARSRAPGTSDDKRLYTDGVITGFGNVEGKKVCIFSQDFTVNAGTLGEVSGEKIHKVIDLATLLGVPLIGINDGGGARVQEGVVALHYYGGIFHRNVAASGVVPQISVIMGSCAGGAVYSPAITDFVFMVRETSQMFITGPDVVKTVTGEDVSLEELGGALTHATKSGVASFVAPDEKSCLDQVRELLAYLPPNNAAQPEIVATGDDPERGVPELTKIVPASAHQPYDMKQLVRAVLDDGDFFEYHKLWAMNLVCGFGRIGGRAVGVVANQPQVLAGVLDIDASEKGARFVRTCDCFNIPVVSFVDVPGFMPGIDQEHGGLIRRGAKLLYAFSEATVPKIQVVVRKAYGAAYIVMGSKSVGADLAYAWPGAEPAVMGPEGAVDILYRRELAGASPERRAELVQRYREDYANPYLAAERGYLDDVIEPAATRQALHRGLAALATKRSDLAPRKHGNLPL